MSNDLERHQRQLDRLGTGGLLGLSAGFLAEAIRQSGLHVDWIASNGTVNGVLVAVWVIGLVGGGLALTRLWFVGRSLDSRERSVLGDELQTFLTQKTAVGAFVATYVAAVVAAAIPATSELPGQAVALAIVAVATAALAIGRIKAARS